MSKSFSNYTNLSSKHYYDTINTTLADLKKQLDYQSQQIAKLQWHNTTLATLIGDVIDNVAVSGSIYELSVLLDLSKDDLKLARQLIADYDGDIHALQQKFANADGNLNAQNLLPIVQAFQNSGLLLTNCQKILTQLDAAPQSSQNTKQQTNPSN